MLDIDTEIADVEMIHDELYTRWNRLWDHTPFEPVQVEQENERWYALQEVSNLYDSLVDSRDHEAYLPGVEAAVHKFYSDYEKMLDSLNRTG